MFSKIYKMGGHGVKIQLKCAPNNGGEFTYQDVYWTSGIYASYVLVEAGDVSCYWLTPDGQKVRLISINGLGEIRWEVTPDSSWGADVDETVAAFKLEKENVKKECVKNAQDVTCP